MPIIIRKGFRFANPLAAPACKKSAHGCFAAAFCIIVSLCTMPIAGAGSEVDQTGGGHAKSAQEKGLETTDAGGHGATPAPAPKKKVVIVQFDVANTQHVDDINNIYDGLPSALSSRLEASGEFLTTYTGRSIPAEASEPQRKAITQIAEEAGAQFLISGMVVNAGISQKKGFWGTSLGRHIEVELAVYDGLTGARLLLRRLDEQARGEVRVGNDKPFGSSIFFETELGQALNRLIDLAVKDIRKALENVPFSAHIIRVEEKKVFLDAGGDSLLKPGDKLVVYVRDTSAPIAGLKGSALGVTDRAADTVTLTRVQPQFSIGELPEDAAKLGIKAGNIARIDPAEQRNLAAKQMEAQQLAKARQEARDEAARVELERAALVEAERVKAEQAAKAEAERIDAEKKAAAQARAQAAAEAKAAKLKARQEARVARIKAAQEAGAKAQAREKARAAAETKAAKLKARQEAKAEAARIKAEKKAQAEAEAQAAAETKAAAAPKSAKTKATQKGQAGMEVRAVAIEDLQRAAAEAEAAPAAAASSVPSEQKKPGVPLKLKQIKP